MRGGYRENAGRKQGYSAKSAEEARRVLAEMVIREITPIGEALISKAKQGEVSAIRELFDRAFGKPKQDLEVNPYEDLRKEIDHLTNLFASIIKRPSITANTN